MEDNSSAVTDFDEALKEINILISNAIESSNYDLKYATYNKSAIVLLCGKFEAFIESFLEEFSYYVLNSFTNKQLNDHIKNHLLENIIIELEKKKPFIDKRNEVLFKFVKILGEEEIMCNEFEINTKFNYGKHGEKELVKLLNKFGFINFAEEEINKRFYSKFNSLNSIRNNILHQDSTPSLTHGDVENYRDEMLSFVHRIYQESLKHIADLKNLNNSGLANLAGVSPLDFTSV
jgi:Glu-tRNA(Gln) amidotransferase subunit E-like FAD-binding protein